MTDQPETSGPNTNRALRDVRGQECALLESSRHRRAYYLRHLAPVISAPSSSTTRSTCPVEFDFLTFHRLPLSSADIRNDSCPLKICLLKTSEASRGLMRTSFCVTGFVLRSDGECGTWMRPPVCGQLASLVELAEPLAGAEAQRTHPPDGR